MHLLIVTVEIQAGNAGTDNMQKRYLAGIKSGMLLLFGVSTTRPTNAPLVMLGWKRIDV